MKNLEINSSINEKIKKGKKLFLVGLLTLGVTSITLTGCSSDVNDIGIIDEGKEAESLGKKESKNLEIGTVVEKIPDAKVLDKENKGYLSYFEIYEKNEAEEWVLQTEAYSLSDGDVNIGYERHNESNTLKQKCVGYMIVPIKYEKKDGEWKKYGKDLWYTETEEWIEIKNKIRTDEELENSQKTSNVYNDYVYQKKLI